MQISLNFQNSYWKLKIRDLGVKVCVVFPLFEFLKDLRHSKIKESTLFVEQKYKLS